MSCGFGSQWNTQHVDFSSLENANVLYISDFYSSGDIFSIGSPTINSLSISSAYNWGGAWPFENASIDTINMEGIDGNGDFSVSDEETTYWEGFL